MWERVVPPWLREIVPRAQHARPRGCRSLPHLSWHTPELDFKHEAANSGRCAANLNTRGSRRVRGRVAVPAVDLRRTSHRVLTMEFVDGAFVEGGAEAGRQNGMGQALVNSERALAALLDCPLPRPPAAPGTHRRQGD